MGGHGVNSWWKLFVWRRRRCASRSIFPRTSSKANEARNTALHPELFGESGKKTAHPSLRYGKAIAREKHGGARG